MADPFEGDEGGVSVEAILDSPVLIEIVRWYKTDRAEMGDFRAHIEREGIKIPPDVTDDILAALQVCARLMTRFSFASPSVSSAHMVDWLHRQDKGYYMEQVEDLIGAKVAELEGEELTGVERVERINAALSDAGYAVKVEASDKPGAYRIARL